MKNMKLNEPVLEEVKEADHALLEESLKKAQELSEKQQVEKDLFKDFQRVIKFLMKSLAMSLPMLGRENATVKLGNRVKI